jgi:tetratricopeptide (TPR) repeat protein
LSSQSAVYGGTWAGVPRILGHLNLSRERFREHFPFSIVFCLPEFALRYFIRRAPDFFDWRSGVYDFPTKREIVNSEVDRLVLSKGGDLKAYKNWTKQKRLQRLTEIRAYLSESPDVIRTSLLWMKKGLIHYAEAITSDKQALKDDARNNRRIALEEAIVSFDQAVKFKPNFHEAWSNRGIVLKLLGKLEEAIASFDQSLKFEPNFYEVWNNRGVALNDLGKLEEAITAFDKSLILNPNFHEAWNNRGLALNDLGRYKEARVSFERALTIKPNYQTYQNNLKSVRRMMGDIPLIYLAKDEKDEAYYKKACRYALENNVFMASYNLKRAIEINAGWKDVARYDTSFDKIRYDSHFIDLI